MSIAGTTPAGSSASRLAATVTDAGVRHLLWLRAQLPRDVVDLVVLTSGTDAHRRSDGVAVVPLALLGL